MGFIKQGMWRGSQTSCGNSLMEKGGTLGWGGSCPWSGQGAKQHKTCNCDEGRAGGITNARIPVLQFEDIQEVIWRYKTLVKMREDLLQARQENREMSEQAEVLLDQYTAEKEAEILQREDELVQLQQHLDQARKNSILWVRKCGAGRGRSPRSGWVKAS